MRLPWQILVIGALVLAIAAGYLINSTVPVFIASVLGLPVAAYVLNRTRPPDSES